MTNIPVPMYCPSCCTTLSCEVRDLAAPVPLATLYLTPPPPPSTHTALWCAYWRCGQYLRTITAAEYIQLPEKDQNLLRWLLDRTEQERER